MSETVIEAVNLTKVFSLRHGGATTLKSFVLGMLSGGRGRSPFRALDDVSFQVKRGETLGIIGANGAGKSTLLSLIAGTMYPTTGTIRAQGNISSLLELGAGFHPDLTGRENIFLYGAIMGIPRSTMKRRFDAIVDMAGLHDFLDQPVRHYSSGMYVRLGFAVAVEVDPDILLIDEVLAVGDSAFQQKCLQKMRDFRRCGKTMLIISHDIRTVQSVSDRILLLDGGRVKGLGDPASVVSSYESITRTRTSGGMGREWGTGEARITGVKFLDAAGKPAECFEYGKSLTAVLEYEASHRIERPVFGFSVADESGRTLYGNNTQVEKFSIDHIEGKGKLSLTLESLRLAGGTYTFSFALHSYDHLVNYHRLDHWFPVTIKAEKSFEGCYMDCHWSH